MADRQLARDKHGTIQTYTSVLQKPPWAADSSACLPPSGGDPCENRRLVIAEVLEHLAGAQQMPHQRRPIRRVKAVS